MFYKDKQIQIKHRHTSVQYDQLFQGPDAIKLGGGGVKFNHDLYSTIPFQHPLPILKITLLVYLTNY